jgi:hypothetical protein
MVGCAHSDRLEIRAKTCRYGRWGRSETQKRRDFQVGMLFPKNGGLAPQVEKCGFPRENAIRYGF